MRTSPFLLFALLLSALPSPAQWTTQTIDLRPGWNAVFLEVQPEPRDCDTLFAGLPVESVWRWNRRFSSVQFIQDPGDMVPSQPDWLTYVPTNRPARATMNLFAIHGGRPYLIKLASTANPVTWTVRGRPVVCRPEWLSDSMNFVGFPVEVASPPTYLNFFASSPAHAGKPVYRLNAAGQWEKVLTPATTAMRNGEAFWVRCAGASTWSGPQDVLLERSIGLDYGRILTEQTVRIRNNAASARTYTVRQLPSASPPMASAPALAGDVPLSYHRFNLASNDVGWTALPAPLTQANLAPGEEWSLRLAVRRIDMAPFAPAPGTAEPLYQSLLEISDGAGSRCTLPVTSLGMQRLTAGGGGGGGSGGSSLPADRDYTGLWVGHVVINKVSRPASAGVASSMFSATDFTGLQSLVVELKEPTKAISTYLTNLLSSATRQLLKDYQGSVSPALATALLNDFNELLMAPPTTFSAADFIDLPSLTRKLKAPTTIAVDDVVDLPSLATKLKSPTAISVGDFVNLPSVASRLKAPAPADAISIYLTNRLSASTRSALALYQGSGSDPVQLQLALTADFNAIIGGVSIWDFQRFTGVVLSVEAIQLITQNPQGDALRRLNRLLLEAAYLLRPADGVSTYLYRNGQLSVATLNALTNYQGSVSDPGPLQTNLVTSFNRIIGGQSIYDSQRFAGIPLGAEAQQLLTPTPQGDALRRLNRLLLEAVYPLRPADAVSTYLKLEGRLSFATSNALANYQGLGSDPDLQAGLAMDFNRIMGDESIYDEERFAGIALRPETQQLLALDPTGNTPPRLERLLLEDAYPREIARNPIASIYDSTRFEGIMLRDATAELLAQNPAGSDLVRLNRLLLEDAYRNEIAAAPLVDQKTPLPTGSEFQFRLIVHVDDSGQPRLLQKVIQVWTNGTYALDAAMILRTNQPGAYALFTDENAVTNSPPWARRISSAAFGFTNKVMFASETGDPFGTTNVPNLCTVTIGFDDPLNPFKHRYHPDHDNLDERFEEILPESFTVSRDLTLEFRAGAPSGPNPAGWGDDQLGGIYRETIRNLHRNPLYVSGTFHLRRVARTGKLN